MNMAKEPKAKPTKAPATKFVYFCPACSDIAIRTSNKMLGVHINCMNCDKLITLDDKKRYKKK